MGGVVSYQNNNAQCTSCTSLNNTCSSSFANEQIFQGGICSFNQLSTLTSCSSYNNLFTTSQYSKLTYVGGITAFSNYSSVISSSVSHNNQMTCFATNLTKVGGITGQNGYNSSITQSTSYNNTLSASTISSTYLQQAYVGGISGGNSQLAIISSCFSNHSKISGYNSAGILGWNENGGYLNDSHIFKNSFYNFTISDLCVAINNGTSQGCIDETCLFKVPNCSYCDSNITNLLTQSSDLLISCQYITPNWKWIYKNSSSDVLFINSSLLITSTTYLIGNITILDTSIVVFDLSTFDTNSSFINITGSLILDGKIQINLNARPNKTVITLLLFNFTSSPNSVKTSQIKVESKYANSKCDKTTYSVNNQPSSLSVSLHFDFNGNCRANLGLIIGLSVGIPLFLILLVLVTLFLIRIHNNRKAEEFANNGNQKNNNNFIDNSSYKEQSSWNEFKTN